MAMERRRSMAQLLGESNAAVVGSTVDSFKLPTKQQSSNNHHWTKMEGDRQYKSSIVSHPYCMDMT